LRGDQLARQWQLIQHLGHHRFGVGLESLAGELGVVRRTVYRDLDALQYAGFPVTSEKRDGRVFYSLLDSFKLGDTPFTTDEILALAFSEDLLRILEGTVFHDSIRSALEKIRASLRPELQDFVLRLHESFRVLPGPHKRYEDVSDVIRVLNEAVLDHITLRMEYTTASSGQVSVRQLDPYRLWYRSGGLYAVGHDHKSGELRTFAVDRIRDPQPTGAHFEVDPAFDFEVYTASAFGVATDPAASVRLCFEPHWALHVKEHIWHPSQQLTERSDGRVDLAMEVGVGHELRNWILSFGAGVLVLAPASLRAEVQAELLAAAGRYA